MKPTEQWLKIAGVIIKVILWIPYCILMVTLTILGGIAWFLSLGHLGSDVFIPVYFIADLYNGGKL